MPIRSYVDTPRDILRTAHVWREFYCGVCLIYANLYVGMGVPWRAPRARRFEGFWASGGAKFTKM